MAACILNKLRGQLSVACVKAPGFGDNRKSILADIGILTGATVFSDEVDVKLEKVILDFYWLANYYIVKLVYSKRPRIGWPGYYWQG